MTIVNLPASATRQLRQRLLRPHQNLEDLVYEGDNSSDTRHFCAFDDKGRHVGVVSIYLQRIRGEEVWQLRAMATVPEVRGQGYGRKLVQAAEFYASSHDKRRGVQQTKIWANARASAEDFYGKLGYQLEGELFEVAEIGPHRLIRKQINNTSASVGYL